MCPCLQCSCLIPASCLTCSSPNSPPLLSCHTSHCILSFSLPLLFRLLFLSQPPFYTCTCTHTCANTHTQQYQSQLRCVHMRKIVQYFSSWTWLVLLSIVTPSSIHIFVISCGFSKTPLCRYTSPLSIHLLRGMWPGTVSIMNRAAINVDVRDHCGKISKMRCIALTCSFRDALQEPSF